MSRTWFRILIQIALGLAPLASAHAVSTKTLPSGIRSFALKTGMVSSLNQGFDEEGSQMGIGDLRAVRFDAQMLRNQGGRSQLLVDALNSIGSQDLGNQLNLGTLKVDAKPALQYMAPVLAYGVQKNWTLALGIPVISYKNNVSYRVEDSNAETYRQMGAGNLSPELAAALNTDPSVEFQKSVNEKGYKPMGSRSESFIGDLQIVSMYRFHGDLRSSSLLQTTVSLPTGPKYDGDDLLAGNIWGRTSVDNTFVYGYRATPRMTLNPYGGVNLFLPDQIERRIPNSEYDSLPAADQKKTTNRQLGASVKVGMDTNYDITRAWSAGLGGEFAVKSEDKYSGSGDLRYDLISKDTDSNSTILRAAFNYSSVAAYRAKKALIPGVLSLGISDIISGKNVLKETRTELTTMLFF